MKRLLLISSSRVHGSGFLEHCRQAIGDHFRGAKSVLFFPFALKNHDQYEQIVAAAFQPLGLQIQSLHRSTDPSAAIDSAEGIFIGGGNSFRLLKTLYDMQWIEVVRRRVEQDGIPYMGSSAGTNMACPTIRTTNDMPIVQPPSLAALGLIPFQINPHYVDPDPNSTHQGETREQRLREYLEENTVPVVGLREGSWLQVDGHAAILRGQQSARVFRPGVAPEEFSPGVDLLRHLAL